VKRWLVSPPARAGARVVSLSLGGGLALVAALLTSACGGSSPSSPTPSSPVSQPSFASVNVVPPHLLPGEAGSASAWGWTTQNNGPIYGPLPVSRWATSDTSVATVDTAGRVTAIGTGTARITATHQGGSAVGLVIVYAESDVEALSISCPASTPLPGGVFCQAFGRTRTASGLEVRVSWSSSNSDVATIGAVPGPSHVALVLGRGAGETVITGTLRGLSASGTVVFLPPRS